MDTLTERLERLAELQKKNIEPLQNLGSSAFVAFERMARKNYELMGDMVDYAVAQSRGSLEPNTPQALYERQMAEARAFAERMSARTAEYVALAEQLRDGMVPGATAGPSTPAGSAARAPAGRTSSDGGTPADVAGVSARGDEGAAGKVATKGKPAVKKADRGSASAGTAPKKSAPKTTAKKTATKKAVAKKAGSKKAGSKKAGSKKATGKRSAARKTGSRKASSK